MEKPDWSNFKAFNGTLKGDEVLRTWKGRKVRKFLRKVHQDPSKHGISDNDHISGVKELYKAFVSRLTAANENAVEVKCHGSTVRILDFDNAIAYFFSVQATYSEPGINTTLLPLLLLYTKFLILVSPLKSLRPEILPSATCIMYREGPPHGTVYAFLGSSLRNFPLKGDVKSWRKKELEDFYPLKNLGSSGNLGNCAETQPILLNLSIENRTTKFILPIQGFAVTVEEVQKMESLGWGEFCEKGGEKVHKGACPCCKNLLELGGQDVRIYDCFPIDMFNRTIRRLEEKKGGDGDKKN